MGYLSTWPTHSEPVGLCRRSSRPQGVIHVKITALHPINPYNFIKPYPLILFCANSNFQKFKVLSLFKYSTRKKTYALGPTLESRMRSATVARLPSLWAQLMLVDELELIDPELLLVLLTMLTLLLLCTLTALELLGTLLFQLSRIPAGLWRGLWSLM